MLGDFDILPTTGMERKLEIMLHIRGRRLNARLLLTYVDILGNIQHRTIEYSMARNTLRQIGQICSSIVLFFFWCSL
jgi:hypothetical protein